MDAVRRSVFLINFGGSYKEIWSENYVLTVSYDNRRAVKAEYCDGWRAVGGDAELCALLSSAQCPRITRQYFEAAAEVQAAVSACLDKNLPLDRLSECFCSEKNPLTAPELMRHLMDDHSVSMMAAYQICASCCQDLMASGIQTEDVYKLQPRTAHVVSILRGIAYNSLAVIHNAVSEEYRTPLGAVSCGEKIRLAFAVRGGQIARAWLVLWGDNFRKEYPMEREGSYYSISFETPDKPIALWYCFKIETEDSSHWLCPCGNGYVGRLFGNEAGGFRLTVHLKDFDTPAWFRGSVMYQIFPDRFAFSCDGTAENGIEYHKKLGQTPELHESIDEPVRYLPRDFEKDYSPDDFYGGTLKGIEEKLPYLRELGISCIYLNPIVEARSNHRYDTSDYMKVDPVLGTNEDMVRLCRRAEDMGIRIILDGVYSHTGADSVYFNRYGNYESRGAFQGADSIYYSWYDFKNFPDDYRCWWGFKDLPEVDETRDDWQNFVITGRDSVIKTWLRRGASGWRLDVADELPDSVLALIRESAKAEKPDAVILGEVWEDAVIKESYGSRRQYALGCALDSVMNYPFRSAVLDFAHGRIDAYSLRDFLIGQQMNYPKPMYYSLMNLLSSHDVDRIRTALAADVQLRGMSRDEQLKIEFSGYSLRHAVELEKLCAAVQFSIPGVPSVYYGDEQGMCGVNDPFNRLPFREGDSELHDYYSGLGNLRNSSKALSTGEAVFMAENGDVLMILRYIRNSADVFGIKAENAAFLSVVNRSDREQSFQADCRAAGLDIICGSVDALSAKIIKLD